jgi:hypothetical protein
MKRALLTALLVIAGCTDAQYGQWNSLGEPAIIDCFNGTQPIYHGRTLGKISTEQGSDGWFFIEVGTGHLIRVSGACVIRQKTSASRPLPSESEPTK